MSRPKSGHLARGTRMRCLLLFMLAFASFTSIVTSEPFRSTPKQSSPPPRVSRAPLRVPVIKGRIPYKMPGDGLLHGEAHSHSSANHSPPRDTTPPLTAVSSPPNYSSSSSASNSHNSNNSPPPPASNYSPQPAHSREIIKSPPPPPKGQQSSPKPTEYTRKPEGSTHSAVKVPSPAQSDQHLNEVVPANNMKMGRFPLDELVNAIAQAAINGDIPFNKVDLRKPFNSQSLQIPILLLRPDDLFRATGTKINFKLITAQPVRIPIFDEPPAPFKMPPSIHSHHQPRQHHHSHHSNHNNHHQHHQNVNHFNNLGFGPMGPGPYGSAGSGGHREGRQMNNFGHNSHNINFGPMNSNNFGPHQDNFVPNNNNYVLFNNNNGNSGNSGNTFNNAGKSNNFAPAKPQQQHYQTSSTTFPQPPPTSQTLPPPQSTQKPQPTQQTRSPSYNSHNNGGSGNSGKNFGNPGKSSKMDVLKVIPAPKLVKSNDAYSNQIDHQNHRQSSFEDKPHFDSKPSFDSPKQNFDSKPFSSHSNSGYSGSSSSGNTGSSNFNSGSSFSSSGPSNFGSSNFGSSNYGSSGSSFSSSGPSSFSGSSNFDSGHSGNSDNFRNSGYSGNSGSSENSGNSFSSKERSNNFPQITQKNILKQSTSSFSSGNSGYSKSSGSSSFSGSSGSADTSSYKSSGTSSSSGSSSGSSSETPKRKRPVIRIKPERPPVRINSARAPIRVKPERPPLRMNPMIRKKEGDSESFEKYEDSQNKIASSSNMAPTRDEPEHSEPESPKPIKSSVIPERYLKDMPPYKTNEEIKTVPFPKFTQDDSGNAERSQENYERNQVANQGSRHSNWDDDRVNINAAFSKTSHAKQQSQNKNHNDFGSVFRKENNNYENNEGGSSNFESSRDSQPTRTTSGNLDDLEKSGYDKQLVKTLKNLMATTGKRHKLNFEDNDEKEEKVVKKGKIPEKYLQGSPLRSGSDSDDHSASETQFDDFKTEQNFKKQQNLQQPYQHYGGTNSDDRRAEDQSSETRDRFNTELGGSFRVSGFDPNYEYLDNNNNGESGLENRAAENTGENGGNFGEVSGLNEDEVSEQIGPDGKRVKTYVMTGVYRKKVDEVLRNDNDGSEEYHRAEESDPVPAEILVAKVFESNRAPRESSNAAAASSSSSKSPSDVPSM